MPDTWDPDTETVRESEIRATATLAAIALLRGQPMPSATPLQRQIGRDVLHAYTALKLARMRARVRH